MALVGLVGCNRCGKIWFGVTNIDSWPNYCIECIQFMAREAEERAQDQVTEDLRDEIMDGTSDWPPEE